MIRFGSDHDRPEPIARKTIRDRLRLKRFHLSDLIATLEETDPDARVELNIGGGFEDPGCWRPDPYALCFRRCMQTRTARVHLAEARSAVGATFCWKGGEYVMDGGSHIWIVHDSYARDRLGIVQATHEGGAVVLWVADME